MLPNEFSGNTARKRDLSQILAMSKKKELTDDQYWWLRRDRRGVDLISDALPFGGLWYDTPDDAVDYAKFFSRSYSAVIRVYDPAGNVIETHQHKGEFREW